jgi:hypothetical protein
LLKNREKTSKELNRIASVGYDNGVLILRGVSREFFDKIKTLTKELGFRDYKVKKYEDGKVDHGIDIFIPIDTDKRNMNLLISINHWFRYYRKSRQPNFQQIAESFKQYTS